MSTTKRKTCHWTQDDEDSDTWETACGHLFAINDGTPVENGMAFCCFCGEVLIELSFLGPDESCDDAD